MSSQQPSATTAYLGMERHAELARRLRIKVYFCDPHSPWLSPTNENTNGLVQQYLPKGADLSPYSRRDLEKIAHSLNTRPRRHCFHYSRDGAPRSINSRRL